MSIYKGSKLVAGSNTTTISDIIKLFKHDWYDYSFSDLSWVRADDFEWIYADRYPIAYEHLYADFISTSTWQSETIGSYTIQFKIAPDGHRITDHANEGTVQNIYGESGVAWYYIIDTVNERFKLPRTKHGITGLRDEVGKYVPESLPNIKGEIKNVAHGASVGASASGAFSASVATDVGNAQSGGKTDMFYFDASTYSETYQDNAPVQERATQQYLYFYLGQFPVSALVNPDIAETKVNTSMDNLNSVGRNIANWSSNVTNCITEIPQDIKLELNDGTLMLKAGSKVYAPNGFESDGTTPKFDVVMIESDVSTNLSWLTSDQAFVFLVTGIDGTALSIGDMDAAVFSKVMSGTTFPTAISGIVFYKTDENLVYRYNAKSDEWLVCRSFPIGIVSAGTSGLTSIDQVFNGFGYIGSIVFALPGVKGLIPNGRNADGSLKNIEFINSKVLVWEKIDNKINDWFFESTNANIPMRGWGSTGVYHSVNSPVTSTYSWSYVVPENQWYYCNSSGVLGKAYPLFFGKDTSTTTTISGFETKTSFRAVDYNDKSTIINWGIPDYAAGISINSPYTCPKHGFVTIGDEGTTGTSASTLQIFINNKLILYVGGRGDDGSPRQMCTLPVSEGDVVSWTIQNSSQQNCAFYPMKGN